MYLSVIINDNSMFQGVITAEKDEHPDEPRITLKGGYPTRDEALLHCTKICDDMSNGIARPDAVEGCWSHKDTKGEK